MPQGPLIFLSVVVLVLGAAAIGVAMATAPSAPAGTWSSALVAAGVPVMSFSAITGVFASVPELPRLRACEANPAPHRAGGAILIIAGIASAFTAYKDLLKLHLVVLLLGIVGGAVLLYGSSLGNVYSAQLDIGQWINNANYDPNGQTAMDLFTLAAFETCCRPLGFAAQAPFGACGVACPSADSGQFYDKTLSDLNSEGQFNGTLLCTCVPDAATYATVAAVVTQQVCTAMSLITTPIPGDELFPTTQYTVSKVLTKKYPSVSFTVYPFVGWDQAPEPAPSNATLYLNTYPLGGGCGFGYPKGLSFVQEMYYNNVLASWFLAETIVGAAALVVVVIAMIMAYCYLRQQGADAQPLMGGLSSFASGSPPSSFYNVPEKQLAAANPMRESQYSSGTMDGSASVIPPSQIVQMPGEYADARLVDALRQFYARTDPSKTEDDLVKYALWGQRYGIDKLNGNLRQKYNADLSSVQQAPQRTLSPGQSLTQMSYGMAASNPPGASQSGDLGRLLTVFYKKYDPLKARKDIDDITAWGYKHGIDALNRQLQKKYNADLTSM